MNFLGYFKSTLKVAVSIFVAVVALTIVGVAIWKVVDYREKESVRPYEVVKEWRVDLTKNLQLRLIAKTKLVDGTLFANFTFDGYPAYFSDPHLFAQNQAGKFNISFSDKDGFKLYEKSIAVSEMTKVVDSSGIVTGLAYQFSEYAGISNYPNFSKLDIGWNLNTDIPKAARYELLPAEKNLDHCAPNLTKEERMRRLGQYGTVRETGYGEFTAGGKSILLSGGTVISCN